MNQYLQNIFYHYALSDTTLAAKVEPDFFSAKPLQICYTYAKKYVLKYHEAPTAAQLKELLKMDEKDTIVPCDTVDVLYSAKDALSQYTKDWLYDNITAWAEWCAYIKAASNMIEYIKLHEAEVSPENVKRITEVAKSTFNRSCTLEFNEDDSNGSDFWDAISHKQIKMKRSSTGYPYFDTLLKGGYFPGALICIMAGPKKGKSLWLQNLCAESLRKGENNLYISLELEEEMIHNRIGSNLFSIPSISYERIAEDTDAMRDAMNRFKKQCIIPPGQLIVKTFPTSTLSVIDLETYILKKEEELSTENAPFKFKNIFVDYINIMKNWRNENTENTYMKIKQIAEDLKAMGKKGGWAIITATQTNRVGIQEEGDIFSHNVAESAGLNATLDLLVGLIQTPEMKARGEYYAKCLLDRVINKADTKKGFTIDWNFLRIAETSEPEIDCSFTPINTQKRTYYNNQNNTQSNINQSNELPEISVPVIGADTAFEHNTQNSNNNNYVSITGNGLF